MSVWKFGLDLGLGALRRCLAAEFRVGLRAAILLGKPGGTPTIYRRCHLSHGRRHSSESELIGDAVLLGAADVQD
jgi:hypothetical protein